MGTMITITITITITAGKEVHAERKERGSERGVLAAGDQASPINHEITSHPNHRNQTSHLNQASRLNQASHRNQVERREKAREREEEKEKERCKKLKGVRSVPCRKSNAT